MAKTTETGAATPTETDNITTDSTALHEWVASALSAYEEAKRRKWSFERLLKSSSWGDERKLRDAFWLALTYDDWKDLSIPTECPIEARRLLEPVLPPRAACTS